MKPTLYSCLSNVKALWILILILLLLLLLFLELTCDDLQGTGENRRKDLSNVAIRINFRQEFFQQFLHNILLSGLRWGNNCHTVLQIELFHENTLFCWLVLRGCLVALVPRRNALILSFWCKHGNELWIPDRPVEGDWTGKTKKGRGKGRRIRKEVLQYEGTKTVWLPKANAFRGNLSSLIHIHILQSTRSIWVLAQNIFWKRWQCWVGEQLLILNSTWCETPLFHITLDSILISED